MNKFVLVFAKKLSLVQKFGQKKFLLVLCVLGHILTNLYDRPFLSSGGKGGRGAKH